MVSLIEEQGKPRRADWPTGSTTLRAHLAVHRRWRWKAPRWGIPKGEGLNGRRVSLWRDSHTAVLKGGSQKLRWWDKQVRRQLPTTISGSVCQKKSAVRSHQVIITCRTFWTSPQSPTVLPPSTRPSTTQHPAPSTQHSAPPAPPAPSTQHPAPGTRHPAPGTRHPAPGTRHPAPSTQHPAPSTQHPALDLFLEGKKSYFSDTF